MKKIKPLFLLIILAPLLWLNNCKKEQAASVQNLQFSTDTLTFDTAFTTLGTATRSFKVFNKQNTKITIDKVRLAGLQGNQFRINVDGVSGNEINNVEIDAKDSIYIFVEVTIDPNNSFNPLVIFDEIQFLDEGQSAKVVLEAWGQDAYYHLSERISGSKTWDNLKPHVVLSKAGKLVSLYIDSSATLNIQAGTRIYMGPGALISVDGTLNALGNAFGDSIQFRGLRLEHSYLDKPGQWFGILYSRTAKIKMNYCVINESTVGLSDEQVLNNLFGAHLTTSNLSSYNVTVPTINLEACIIKNASSTCLSAIYSDVKATNCLFHSAGGQLVLLAYGGTYNLKHCTIANVYYRSLNHENESLSISDELVDESNQAYQSAVNVQLTNCVVYGTLTNELLLINNHSSTIKLDHCLLKQQTDSFSLPPVTDSLAIFLNQNPKFRNPENANYSPDSLLSPLVNTGVNIGVSTDLYGKPRDSQPDIGAIEW